MGGGHHYTQGNYKLIDKTKARIGKDNLILMEDNKEDYIGYTELTVSWMGMGREQNVSFAYLQPLSIGTNATSYYDNSKRSLVPAFQAVYGGYMLQTGGFFWGWDNPDMISGLLAAQWSFGLQLGWWVLDLPSKAADGVHLMDP